jgi:hypothetical protein
MRIGSPFFRRQASCHNFLHADIYILKCFAQQLFTFEAGRKIMAAAQWWQRYLGFYEIPVGTRLLLHYRENSRKEVYLDEVERI